MIDGKAFIAAMKSFGIAFYAGVPDSLLAPLIEEFSALSADQHVISANEGSAVALAAGHFLATGKTGAVYLQNSGLGNAINPLLSLTAEEVYSIPILLIIGWRGQPGSKDEPQHAKQGAINEALLRSLEIPYYIVDKDCKIEELEEFTAEQLSKPKMGPFALLVSKGSFSKSTGGLNIKEKEKVAELPTREAAIACVVASLTGSCLFVASTGKIGRELYEFRKTSGQNNDCDFYCVGSMGHANQVALGLAMRRPELVVCLDGDGAALMHLGNLASVASLAPSNFLHIVLNNRAHESVGGQATAAPSLDFASLGSALGYKSAVRAASSQQIREVLSAFSPEDGPMLLEIQVQNNSRDDLSRPSETPQERKEHFMKAMSLKGL